MTAASNRARGAIFLVFAASWAATIVWCRSMAAMGGMPMPGGWTMSMAWMRMPGESWPEAAAQFTGMWTVMMVAMMLPSLAPALRGLRFGRLSAIVCAGYFVVWAVCGVVAFPLGIALASAEMRYEALARAFPVLAGVVVLVAGALQLTEWKRRRLFCCRHEHEHADPKIDGIGVAWRHGVRLGIQCVVCCGNLMTLLLVVGVMDLRAMAAVTAAVTAERLAPAGEQTARTIGVVIAALGVFLVARAFGLGA